MLFVVAVTRVICFIHFQMPLFCRYPHRRALLKTSVFVQSSVNVFTKTEDIIPFVFVQQNREQAKTYVSFNLTNEVPTCQSIHE